MSLCAQIPPPPPMQQMGLVPPPPLPEQRQGQWALGLWWHYTCLQHRKTTLTHRSANWQRQACASSREAHGLGGVHLQWKMASPTCRRGELKDLVKALAYCWLLLGCAAHQAQVHGFLSNHARRCTAGDCSTSGSNAWPPLCLSLRSSEA